METALSENDFLAGCAYSLADCALTPYANRLFDLGLLGLWATAAPNMFGWYSRIRERNNFAPAITDYLTDTDRALLANVAPETLGQVRTILDSN